MQHTQTRTGPQTLSTASGQQLRDRAANFLACSLSLSFLQGSATALGCGLCMHFIGFYRDNKLLCNVAKKSRVYNSLVIHYHCCLYYSPVHPPIHPSTILPPTDPLLSIFLPPPPPVPCAATHVPVHDAHPRCAVVPYRTESHWELRVSCTGHSSCLTELRPIGQSKSKASTDETPP